MFRLKFLSDAEKNRIYHGDVLITPSAIPSEAVPFDRADILGYGETTGAAHRIVGGEFQFLQWQAKNYLRVVKEAKITHDHDGHHPVVLPPGDYQFGNAREYDYDTEESRKVAD